MSKKTKAEKAAQRKTQQVSRERLERITKARKHRVRTTSRVFKYGIKSFIRNSWLSIAAIAIMAITLIILGVALIAGEIMKTTIAMIESQIEISIYIKQEATQEQVKSVISKLMELDNVTGATTVSPDEARTSSIEAIISENNITDRDTIATLYGGPNKLPWFINIQLATIDNIGELETFVENDDTIQSLLDSRPPSYADKNRATIENISNVMGRVRTTGLVAAAVFAVIAILIVFNTIRMAIFNRKEEIYMMKLVGASRWFIKGPFVIEASLYGVIAALIAFAGINGVAFASKDMLGTVIQPTIALMRDNWYYVMLSLQGCGIMIGIVSSLLAIRKYIKVK